MTPAATFVAVAGTSDSPDTELSETRRPEPRTRGSRLHDAALEAIAESSPMWAAVALLGVGVACAVLTMQRVGAPWATLVLLGFALATGVLSEAHARWQTRRPQIGRACLLIGAAAAAALVLSPWAAAASAGPEWMWLTATLIAAVALAGAAAFAPLPRLAWCAAALPLSPALAAQRQLAAGPGAAILVGCLFACAAAALFTRWRRASWAQAARTLLERDDRIRALEEERDAAQRADQEKSRFLTIASHDLRQPVHALGLFAATLDKRLQGSPDEHLVRNMIRSIDGLDRSFNAMLDISRLDAGTIEPNVQHFPLRDLFRRLHMHFAGQAEMRGLGLRFSPGGKAVSSDPQLLERILGNLVQNAIKYTEQGGVVVVARSTRTRINVEIWDTGIGIHAGELPRVFDEFYQVGRGERARSRGLGMGLAIVKRLARLLGHELTVASRPGKGTLFRIGIALSDLPEIQDATAAADTLPMPLAQSRTVLILDDEEAIREGLSLLLEEWGYDAIAAGSIAEAERAVFKLDAPPDLILSDLHLGDGPDGLAAIAAIRQQCGHDVAAIVITGDTSHGEMMRVTESGHPVLFKPVQPRKLYNVLRGLLT